MKKKSLFQMMQEGMEWRQDSAACADASPLI